ncbi:MAG: AAA family ATPase [Eubacteriaceae bacterium]|nr:AAA family ATPase [Eubacteriaceae bacterium]
MELQTFATNVTTMKTETEMLVETVTNQQHKTTLEDFIVSITKLSDFLDNAQNVKALSEYDKKPDANKDNCPLDIFCKDLFAKLVAVEPLLISSVFDFLRPENQPTVDAMGQRVMPATQYNQNGFNLLNDALKTLFANNLPEAFEALKYLSGHNKTLIILGPNGSGKTSFANYLKSVETHVKVIPASKPTKAMGYVPNIYNSTIEQYNSEIFQGGDLKEDLLQKLIIGLCTEHDNAARKFYDTGEKDDTTFEKVKRIFDNFFDVKLDNSNFGNKQLQGKKTGLEAFPFNNMSDGERVAFFYIATVIVAPPQSFIVVDEPESHLNPAIYNKVWDRLMEVRSDCQFIFISHTMEFINARSDFELVKIKCFTYPNKFDFEFLGSTLEDLSSDFIVEVVGSRKPILFCEGSKTDYDFKVYENLFGDKYTVIPTGNCASVENSVDACNAHATTYSIQSAVGIIDSDLKSDAEINRLKANKVYALKCNEIEMLLLDEAIFKKVLAQIYKPEMEFAVFKTAFFAKLTERKQYIIKRLVKTQIDGKLKSSVIDDKTNKTQEELRANLSSIFGGFDVDTLWAACDSKITDIIMRQDYDTALKYCCLEHTEVIVGVGKPFVTGYATIALGVLKDDATLAASIKTKYFGDSDL